MTDNRQDTTSDLNSRVRVTVSKTLMPEQYEPVRFELSVEENVPQGVKKSEHISKLFEQIQRQMKQEFMKAGVIE